MISDPAHPHLDDLDDPDSDLGPDSCLLRTPGHWLRAARKQAGYSGREFADKIGVHQSQVSNYENDRRTVPADDRIEAIAAALGMEPGAVRAKLDPANWPDPPPARPPAPSSDPGPGPRPRLMFGRATSGATPERTTAYVRFSAALATAAMRAGADPERLFDSKELDTRLSEIDPASPSMEEEVAAAVAAVLESRPYLRGGNR